MAKLMRDNAAFGWAGLVLLAVASTLVLLAFLPGVAVVAVLGLLAAAFGLLASKTGQGKCSLLGGVVVVTLAVGYWLFLTPGPNSPGPPRQQPQAVEGR